MRPFIAACSLICRAIVVALCFVASFSSSALSSDELGVRAFFNGGVLHVEWDTAVPSSVTSSVIGQSQTVWPFEGFNVGITAGSERFGLYKDIIDFGCGVQSVHTATCPGGSKTFDLSALLLQGKYPREIVVGINVAAMYIPKTVGMTTFFSGSLQTTVPTPPFSMAVTSGSGQKAQPNKVLEQPLIVQVSRLGQPLAPAANQGFAGGIWWSVSSFPRGAFPGSFTTPVNDFLNASGQAGTSYRLGTLEGDYTVQASCALCENNAVFFTATAGEETLKLEKVTSGRLAGSAGEVLKPLVVKVTDEAGTGKSGVHVSYRIISQPTGAVAATPGNLIKTTASDGTASAALTLGDKVGPYTVEVTCQTCTTGSPLTFTAQVTGPEGCTGNGATIASQVNFASGNLFYTQNLLSLTGTGPQVGLTLAFNSLDQTSGPLGVHWTHTYDMQITRDSGGFITLKEESGKRIVFSQSSANLFVPIDHFARPGITLDKFSDGSYRLNRRDGMRYLFNAAGKLTEIIDRNDNGLSLVYVSGRLTALTDPAGRETSLAYDAQGRLTRLTDPAGRSTLLTYDEAGRLNQITDPAFDLTRFLYDAKDQMIRRIEPDGSEMSLSYDLEGRLIQAIDASGLPMTVTYQPEINQATLTDRGGGITTYIYDLDLDQPLLISGPDGGITTNTYDARGNLITSTDPAGNVTRYAYDVQGNMASVTDPGGQVTQYTYDPVFNQLTSITDPQGNLTSNTYDPKGNLTSVIDPAGAVTDYGYDVQGRLTRLTDPQGLTSTFAYDTAGNLTQTTDPAGAVTTMAYDAVGNLISRSDAAGAETRFEYDLNNRLLKVTDALGHITRFTYDSEGRRTSQTDALGRTTQYRYTYLDKLSQVTDPAGGITPYTYDAKGNLTGITDAKGNHTSYIYDSKDRLASETDPLGNTIQYRYDTQDNLISKTDAEGQTITYTYDALNRLTQKATDALYPETYTYDENGRILSVNNGFRRYHYTYDAAGRTTAVTDSRGNTLRYAYNAAGQRTKLIYPDGKEAAYHYDSAGRLSALSDWRGGTTVFIYDALGRRTEMMHANGTKSRYTYDLAGRLRDLVHQNSSGVIIDQHTYSHDATGNRLNIARPQDQHNYVYDPLDRLLQNTPTPSTGADPTLTQPSELFSYDPVGNRVTGPESTNGHSYNTGNQLISSPDKTYEYDNNGNLIYTSSPEATIWYFYDFENRLRRVWEENAAGQQTKNIYYRYDAFGRRVEKIVQTYGSVGFISAHVYFYLYDNEDIVVTEKRTFTSSGLSIEKTTTLHGPGIDEPLMSENSQGTQYYHADGLGSIVALTDASQQVVERYSYSSFGEIKKKHGIENPYTYTGREFDEETGLYFYRARYYDAEVGRFLSEDPIGFRGGDMNFYTYVKNNPVNNIDPDGEKVYSCTRALNVPLGGEIMDYLNLGHQYLWIDSKVEGYGLAPKGWYAAFQSVTNPLLPVPGEITVEGSRGSDDCSLVTDDPCQEKKIAEAVTKEGGKVHFYNLVVNNCYTWVSRIIRSAN